MDKGRFRANRCVKWDDATDPYYEFSLVGKRLKIAGPLAIPIIERAPRCKIITLDLETAEKSPALLAQVCHEQSGYAGVYATVLPAGPVCTADPIVLC